MAKYRSLTLEELSSLEKEFIDFLVLNGITADDWVQLKATETENAALIIDQFSDVVFEGILRKAKYLEKRTKQEFATYHCLDNSIVKVAMVIENDDVADFTDPKFIEKATKTPPKNVKVYTGEKKYKTDRESEIFALLNNGCVITDGKMFKVLCLSL